MLCDQFGALVTARFELLLELAVLGFGRARAEAKMPALHAAVRAPKAEAGAAKKVEKKGKATKVDGGKQEAKAVAAPPARPSAPPPN